MLRHLQQSLRVTGRVGKGANDEATPTDITKGGAANRVQPTLQRGLDSVRNRPDGFYANLTSAAPKG